MTEPRPDVGTFRNISGSADRRKSDALGPGALGKASPDEMCRKITCSASLPKGLKSTGIFEGGDREEGGPLPRAGAEAKRLLVEPGVTPRSANMRRLSSTEMTGGTLGNCILCIMPVFCFSSTCLGIVSILRIFCFSSFDKGAGIQSTSDRRSFGEPEAVGESSAVERCDLAGPSQLDNPPSPGLGGGDSCGLAED
jgi:hypothetical protein